MKKKILSFVLMICVIVPALVLVGCKATSKTTMIGEFKLESLRVMHVYEDSYNLEIALTNTSDENKEFDFSEIVIKFDGREITHNGSVKSLESGEYRKYSFMIDDGHNLRVGDKVDIYYGEDKLKTLKVVEF